MLRKNVMKIHLKLSQTYKELKSILPSGFIKTNIFSLKTIPLRNQNSNLINLKKQYKNNKSDSKELVTNQNIYLFSDTNKNSKKIISKLKNYFSFNTKKNKLNSFKSEINLDNNKFNSISVKKTVRIPKIAYNIKSVNQLKNEDKSNLNSKLNLNNIKLNYEFIATRKSFRSTSIDNSMMRNNICLPSLTERLKTKLPRYEREQYGLYLKNYKINYVNNIEINKNTLDKGTHMRKKFLNMKFNKANKNKYIFYRKRIKLSNTLLNQLKTDDSVEIKSIKKLNREGN
jgi:hypothetical protein